MKAGKRRPLTALLLDELSKGPGTSDALARRVRRPSRDVGKALSQLKRVGNRARFKVRDGEPVWERTPERKKSKARKR